MTKEQKQVRDFMVKFGQDCPNRPTEEVSLDTRKLRANLIMEEALETIKRGLGLKVVPTLNSVAGRDDTEVYFIYEEGSGVDLVELADGLADIHYVAYCGTANAFGIDMQSVFGEVHRSNMSKFWSTEDLESISQEITDNTIYNVESVGDRKYIVKRREDGKVIKPPSYSKADLDSIIKEQQEG